VPPAQHRPVLGAVHVLCTEPPQTLYVLQGMMAGFMLFSVFIMPKLKVDPEVR